MGYWSFDIHRELVTQYPGTIVSSVSAGYWFLSIHMVSVFQYPESIGYSVFMEYWFLIIEGIFVLQYPQDIGFLINTGYWLLSIHRILVLGNESHELGTKMRIMRMHIHPQINDNHLIFGLLLIFDAAN